MKELTNMILPVLAWIVLVPARPFIWIAMRIHWNTTVIFTVRRTGKCWDHYARGKKRPGSTHPVNAANDPDLPQPDWDEIDL